jgi:hypothetical protein
MSGVFLFAQKIIGQGFISRNKAFKNLSTTAFKLQNSDKEHFLSVRCF